MTETKAKKGHFTAPIFDVISLILIMSWVPGFIRTGFLWIYVFAKSSTNGPKFFLRKLFLIREPSFFTYKTMHFRPWRTSSFTSNKFNFWTLTAMGILNMVLVTFTNYWYEKHFAKYVELFAEAIVASDIIGSTARASPPEDSMYVMKGNSNNNSNSNHYLHNTGNNFIATNQGKSNTNTTNATTTTTITSNNTNTSITSTTNNNTNTINKQLNSVNDKNDINENIIKLNNNNTSSDTNLEPSIGNNIPTILVNGTASTPNNMTTGNKPIIMNSNLPAITMTSSSMFAANKNEKSLKNSLRNHRIFNAIISFKIILIIKNFLKKLSVSNTVLGYMSPHWNLKFTNVNHLVYQISMNFLSLNEYQSENISKSTQMFSKFIYMALCVHVVNINLLPIISKYFIFSENSRTLDNLSSLVNAPSFNFKRKDESTHNNLISSFQDEQAVNSIEKMEDSKISEVLVPEELGMNDENEFINSHISDASIIGHNFETFCSNPLSLKNSKPSLLINTMKSNETSLSSPNFKKGRSRSSTLVSSNNSNNNNNANNSNYTTIIYQKLVSEITLQPLWSFLAALKILLKYPRFFAGDTISYKDPKRERFLNTGSIPLSMVHIDDTKVVYKFMDVNKLTRVINRKHSLEIKLNDVEWLHVKFYSVNDYDHYICIYGLTPLFQYNLDVYEKEGSEIGHGKLIANYIFNTVSSSSISVLNQSHMSSSLITLQSSLLSTIEKLNETKTRLKKHKREENKKITDIKKDIEILKNKISKYNTKNSTNESRVSGKLKGLKHAVIQLEQEIENLRAELNQSEEISHRKEPALEEQELQLTNDIKILRKTIEKDENSLSNIKSQLNKLTSELDQQTSKHERLESKKQLRNEELTRVLAEIKNTKKVEMVQKSHKRNKRFQERYEIVLPKLSEAMDKLQAEIQELSNA